MLTLHSERPLIVNDERKKSQLKELEQYYWMSTLVEGILGWHKDI